MIIFKENEDYSEEYLLDTFSSQELEELLKRKILKFTSDSQYKMNFVGSFFTKSSFVLSRPKYSYSNSDAEFVILHDVMQKYAELNVEQSAVDERIVHHFSEEGQRNSDLYELYLLLKEDYLNNGLLVESIAYEEIKRSGRINWSLTLKKIEPIITENGALYDKYYVSKRFEDTSIVTRIHATTLTYLSRLFNGGNEFLELKNIVLGDSLEEYYLSILLKELNLRNYDREVYVLKMLVACIDDSHAFKGSESIFSVFGTCSFWAIWEQVCKVAFNDNYDIYKKFIPETIYENEHGKIEKLGTQRPDLICSFNDKLYIMDAKYYLSPKNIPLGDVVKQFQYVETIELENIAGNFLILPKENCSSEVENLGKIYFQYKEKKSSSISCVALNVSFALNHYLNGHDHKNGQQKIRAELFA